MLHLIRIISLTLIPVSVTAMQPDTARDSKGNNGFIQKMDQHLALKLSINNDIQTFRVKSDLDYTLRPNATHMVKLSGHYRFISFAAGFALKFIPGNNDNTLKGNTKTYNLSMNLDFGHWQQGIQYTRIKGLYLDNTADFAINWIKGTDPYIQFPDLVYNGFQGYTGYKFNTFFSNRALSSQTERQVKDAGTFMPMLVYRYFIMDDQTELTGQNSSQMSNNLEVFILGGYYRTFIFARDFYVSAGLAPGFGIIFTKLLTRFPLGEDTRKYHNMIWRLEGQFALGYNAERFFAGAQLVVSGSGHDQNKSSTIIVNERFTYQVFFGYRFSAPYLLQKRADKLEERLKPFSHTIVGDSIQKFKQP